MNPSDSTSPTFLRFLVVGAVCYALNLALLWLAVERAGIHYVPASLLCVGVMLVLGHFLNRRHTFRSSGRYGPEFLRFALARVAQIGLGLGAIVLLVEFTGVQYLVANVLVTIVTTVASFLAQRHFVFARPKSRSALG